MAEPRPRRRRFRLIAVLTVVAVLLAAGVVTWARIPRDDLAMLEAGGLQVAAEVAGSTTAGDLTVTVSTDPAPQVIVRTAAGTVWSRSEERRVGKECRYRWATEHYKEKRTTDERHEWQRGKETPKHQLRRRET